MKNLKGNKENKKEETMKTISRNHDFENKLNFVQKGRRYFYLYHETSMEPIMIEITERGKRAFDQNDWYYFCKKEAEFFGGVYDEVEN